MQRNTSFLNSEQYSTIYNNLSSGVNNGISLTALCNQTGLADRELRKTIEIMRCRGVVILSGNAGYYLPESADEILAYIRQEEARAKANRRKLAGAKRLFEEWTRGR